jgi:hypothetical protein
MILFFESAHQNQREVQIFGEEKPLFHPRVHKETIASAQWQGYTATDLE